MPGCEVKRAFDIVVSALGLAVSWPVMLIVALAVRIALGRPVLFRQLRPGLGGRPFLLLKFRTMLDTCDRQGNPIFDEERLTPFGAFLRSTSLDELPQLWNVFRGDMSIVGPRPLMMQYLERYSPEQSRRHEVKPGVTGWAQVNGRNSVSWSEKLAMDVWYVDNRSFLLDLRILWRTVRGVITREGISSSGSATMPEFMGNGDAGATTTAASACTEEHQ